MSELVLTPELINFLHACYQRITRENKKWMRSIETSSNPELLDQAEKSLRGNDQLLAQLDAVMRDSWEKDASVSKDLLRMLGWTC